MRAIELPAFGIDNLIVVERPEPQPGSGQVLLKMRAWSLNYRDLLVVKGQYNPRLRLPLNPLSDGVGEVAALGPGVSRVKVGDRVAGLFVQKWLDGELTDEKLRSSLGGGGTGLLADYVVLSEDGVIPVPPHLTDAEAATLPCAALTAWQALITAGQLKPGDTVLTQGTGGVSLFALQFAVLAGARVLITSGSDEKLQRALKLGAAAGTNYKTGPDWDVWAREQTGGIGVDHVIELGGAGTLPRSFKAVRPGGRISLIGVLTGNAGEVNPVPVLMKNLCLQGIFVGSGAMFAAMNRAIAQHQLRPVVDREFAFAEAAAAFRYLESGSHFGKVTLRS